MKMSERNSFKPLVIIPTYNERENIQRLIPEILNIDERIHVLVVDDGSPDGTAEEVSSLIASFPGRALLSRRPGKMGLGSAYVHGFLQGLDKGYDFFIQMDADWSHHPRYLPEMVRLAGEADFVIGSRYVSGGGTLNWGLGRRIISRFGSLYARTVLGVKIADFTGGFNGWSADTLRGVDVRSLRSNGYSFQIELKYRAHRLGFRRREFPIFFDERRSGKSKMSPAIALEAFWRVWELRLRKRSLRMADKQTDIEKLVALVARLRGENGCPWDREQTRETLKPMLVEEAFETLDALDSEDPADLKEELGDLLFQVVFHAQIAREKGEFDLGDVIDRSYEKMTRRHPHIFGAADLKTSEDVLKNWEDIKALEKGIASPSRSDSERSLLDGIPKKIPAFYRAYQITAKAARVGFDWQRLEDIFDKLDEEATELKEAISRGDHELIADEIGDLLFVAVNIARTLEMDPETALERSARKFERRFRFIETAVKKQGRELKDVSPAEMDDLWNEAKKL